MLAFRPSASTSSTSFQLYVRVFCDIQSSRGWRERVKESAAKEKGRGMKKKRVKRFPPVPRVCVWNPPFPSQSDGIYERFYAERIRIAGNFRNKGARAEGEEKNGAAGRRKYAR